MKISRGFVVVSICLGLVIAVRLSCALFAKESVAKFLQRVPIGSRVSDLSAAIPEDWKDHDVMSWVPLKSRTDCEYSSPYRKTGKVAFGVTWYRVEESQGQSIPEISGRFTGEIMLYRDLLPSGQVAMLVYIDGVLKWKDWGYLPG